MNIKDFKLERYFAIHEFSAKYLLSSSDCDGYKMSEILDLADEKELELWDNLTLGYTESTGHPLLKKAILKQYEQHTNKQTLTEENIVVSSPGELAFILMNSILSEQDHAIVISPSYQSLYEVIRSIGTEISFWKPQEQEWNYDVNDIEKLIKPNTKLIVINFPHNPTGAYLKKEEYEKLIEIARKHNIYIYSDEMYYKLNLDEEYPILPPMACSYEKGISLWGMAKSFGLAGLRIGWLASPDTELLKKIVSFKDYLSICSSAPSEILSLIALNHSETLIEKNLKKIKENIKHFETFLEIDKEKAEKDRLFSQFIKPKAGSVAFVKINPLRGNSLDFSNALVQSKGIMTVPSEMFDYPSGYLRIGFGRENFKNILKNIK